MLFFLKEIFNKKKNFSNKKIYGSLQVSNTNLTLSILSNFIANLKAVVNCYNFKDNWYAISSVLFHSS